jgi:predicted nuclease of predicted toxin-antitoxin system
MTLDAHISPKLVPWLRDQFNLEATHIRHLSLHQAEDTEIFETARRSNVVVITKDQDFLALLERLVLLRAWSG